MKKQFLSCKDRKTAQRRCPWAAKIVKVELGYICFESIDDYLVWKKQK